MSIMEKAEKLAQEIVNTSEYSELKNAEKNMYEDEQAKTLLDDFESIQKRVQMMQANGKKVQNSQQKKLQNLKAKMQSNNKINNYMEKQKQFNQVMQTVNQVISDKLQDENEEDENQAVNANQ